MVRTLRFHCRGHEFDPWLGNKDPAHTAQKKVICFEFDLGPFSVISKVTTGWPNKIIHKIRFMY